MTRHRTFRNLAIFLLLLLILGAAYRLHEHARVRPKPDLERPQDYPTGLLDKFAPNGSVRHFPGNTIHSEVEKYSDLYESLLVLHERLEASPLSYLYVLLPISSWHMTIFEGAVNKGRRQGKWPADMPLSAPIEEVTAHFEKKLRKFQYSGGPRFGLSLKGFMPLETGIALHLQPDAWFERDLRSLRISLAQTLSMRESYHEDYVFHISVAYLLRHLNPDQKNELNALLEDHLPHMPKAIQMAPAALYSFEDMFAFENLLVLQWAIEEPI
jgi:hypothetical protein